MARPARVGRFGRMPRARPPLASLLISIAREQEAQRDQNIMDAWSKGGMFEGAPVTDAMMLDHWRRRLQDISPDDPLYDTYSSAILQYEYAIEESRISVQYAQGQVSDAEMAAFYLRWAKRMAPDSQIFRRLQRDAADHEQRQRQRDDRDIAQAWEKGGVFRGAPVTDEMLLNHWRSRLAGMSPGDPQYDEYKSVLLQYEYIIEDDKMRTRLAAGEIDEGDMAEFYRSWAERKPPESAMFRDLTQAAEAHEEAERVREDQDILNAWSKGDLLDGKRVTDGMLLAHWRNRLKGLVSGDPLYDEYRSLLNQSEFAIEESRMTLRYAQGKATDSDMAAFYGRWAARNPTDSEMYRTLQRDAAQYLARVRQASQAAARRALAADYDRRMTALENQQQSGRFVTALITTLAQQGVAGRGAFLPQVPIGGLAGATGLSNIEDMPPLGAEQLMWAIGQVNVQPGPPPRMPHPGLAGKDWQPERPQEEWIFTDDQGKRWTRGEILGTLRDLDPSFDGVLTMDYVADRLQAQVNAIQQQIRIATGAGKASHVDNLRQRLSAVTEQMQMARAVPVIQRYVEIRQRMEEIFSDPSLLPAAHAALIRAELAKIGQLANDPSIANDGNLQSRLRGEATLQAGTVTVWEDMFGTRGVGQATEATTGTGAVRTDVGRTALIFSTMQGVVDDVAKGRGILTQGTRAFDSASGTFTFTPEPGGRQWGTATPDVLSALPGASGAQMTLVPNGDGRGVSLAYIVPRPIFAVVRDQRLQDIQYRGVDEPVGWYFEQVVNGQVITSFLMEGVNGRYVSTEPGFDPALLRNAIREDGYMKIDISAAILARLGEAGIDALPGDVTGQTMRVPGVQGMFVVGRTAREALRFEMMESVDPISGRARVVPDRNRPVPHGTEKAGHIEIDLNLFVAGTDPTLKRGYDRNTDSPSLLLTTIKGMSEGRAFLDSVRGTPYYDLVISNSVAWSVNGTVDPETGAIMPAPGAEELLGDMYESVAHDELFGRRRAGGGDWRDTPTGRDLLGIGAMRRDRRAGATGLKGAWGLWEPMAAEPLPLDKLRMRGDLKFAPLYGGMRPGTNQLEPVGARRADPVRVDPALGLRLPTFETAALPGARALRPVWEPPALPPSVVAGVSIPTARQPLLSAPTRNIDLIVPRTTWEPPAIGGAGTAPVRIVDGQKQAPVRTPIRTPVAPAPPRAPIGVLRAI